MFVTYADHLKYAGLVYAMFTYALEAMLVVDMVSHSIRAFYSSNGSIIFEPAAIRTRYLSTSFVADLVAAFPISLIVAWNGHVSYGYLAWLRVPKMIRMYRARQFYATSKRKVGKETVATGILRLLPQLFLLIHLYACALRFVCFAATDRGKGKALHCGAADLLHAARHQHLTCMCRLVVVCWHHRASAQFQRVQRRSPVGVLS